MSLHLTDEEIKNYHQHKLPDQRLLTADLHLTECEDCQKRLGEISNISMKKVVSTLHQELSDTARSEEDHIFYEELELFVDGKLDDVELEIVQSHLHVCTKCSTEADDLRIFREKFNQPLAEDSGLVIPWNQGTAFKVFLRIAGVAAMIALFVWAATLTMRDRIKELQAELDRTKIETARLTQQNSELLRQSNKLQTQIAHLQGSQSPVIASLKDSGRVVSLHQNGNIAGISSASPTYLKMTEDALAKQTVNTPAFLAGLIGKQGSMLGGTESGQPFDLIAPVGTVLSEDKPNFRWKSLKDAIGYRARVYDRNFKEIASSDTLQSTNWTPSNSFERGKTYSWIVTAYLPDKEVSSPRPPAPEARFIVLDSDQYDQLQQAKQDLAQSHLLSGLVYAEFGLLDDSIREFQLLVNENPDSPIAKKLLDRVHSVRKK